MNISVVIPTLNEERCLPGLLEHLAGMTFDDIIVVDGGSQDRTLKVVQPFALSTQHSALSTVRLLAAPSGRASQMNAGAAAAHGDVLLFLHADTRLPADACTQIHGTLSDPACVGGRFDVRFDRETGLGWLVSGLMNLRSRWTGISTGDQAIFVRRPVFEKLGGFADLPLMEDVEFSRRLKAAGHVAALRAKVVTSYRRWNACGPVRTIMLMWWLRLLYWVGVSPHKLRHLYGEVR